MVASELKIADKWDHAIETGIKRTAYGILTGAVLAALLFRMYFEAPPSLDKIGRP